MSSAADGCIDQGVDWSAPWLAELRTIGQQIARADDWRHELNRQASAISLSNHRQLPIRFVEQQALPPGESYEAFISATGQVPTRDNLHDFFNALVWITYPSVKAQLNALQAAQIASLGIGKSRGPSRDAATLFDENAALLAVSDTPSGHALAAALRAHQWQRVFIEERQQFQALTKVVLFGHAIMEKLANPYKSITAHTLICWVEPEFHASPWTEQRIILDRQIAAQLTSHQLLPNAFSPLPILGVPGWWPIQDDEFYADANVFRPARVR
ncbi:hypothetical protein AAKU67_001856 [Oxalobacteraceae bacterium GrIS 2.11]